MPTSSFERTSSSAAYDGVSGLDISRRPSLTPLREETDVPFEEDETPTTYAATARSRNSSFSRLSFSLSYERERGDDARADINATYQFQCAHLSIKVLQSRFRSLNNTFCSTHRSAEHFTRRFERQLFGELNGGNENS